MSTAIMAGQWRAVRPHTPPDALVRRAWRVLAEQILAERSDDDTVVLAAGRLELDPAGWDDTPIGAQTVRELGRRYVGRAAPLTPQQVARIEARDIAASHLRTLVPELDMCMGCPGPSRWPCERSRWASGILRRR